MSEKNNGWVSTNEELFYCGWGWMLFLTGDIEFAYRAPVDGGWEYRTSANSYDENTVVFSSDSIIAWYPAIEPDPPEFVLWADIMSVMQ